MMVCWMEPDKVLVGQQAGGLTVATQRRPASRRRRIPPRMPVRLSGLWKAGVAMQAIARSARTEHARPDQTTTPSAAAAAAVDVGEGCAVERRLSSMSMSVAETSTREGRPSEVDVSSEGSTTVTVDGVDSDTTAWTTADHDVTSSLDDVKSAGDAPSDGLDRRVPDGEQDAEILSEDRPGRSIRSSYDFGKSTAENYRVEHQEFSDRFRDARSLLDYSYHDNYCLERQKVQDDIILEALGSTTPSFLERPWAVFTAGAMGAGKSHVMELLGERGIFPLDSFVRVDPDRLRRELPEMEAYVRRDPVTAGLLTHKEAGLMAEILEETSLLEGRNILVDGSMRDGEWYAQHVADLRRRFPMLRVAIIHVWAPREQVLARAARRGIQTGRVIPPAVLEETLQAVPRSVEKLAPFVDYSVRIDNIGDTASPSSKLCPDGGGGRSTCGELCSGSEEPECNGSGESACNGWTETACNSWAESSCNSWTESACNGSGKPECNGSEGSIAGLPILATPGETWETFRRTFQGPCVGMVPERKVPKGTEEPLNLPVEVE